MSGHASEAAGAVRAVKIFQQYDAEARANHAASHRLGHRQREACGEFFWWHPALPNASFPSRKSAEAAAARLTAPSPAEVRQ